MTEKTTAKDLRGITVRIWFPPDMLLFSQEFLIFQKSHILRNRGNCSQLSTCMLHVNVIFYLHCLLQPWQGNQGKNESFRKRPAMYVKYNPWFTSGLKWMQLGVNKAAAQTKIHSNRALTPPTVQPWIGFGAPLTFWIYFFRMADAPLSPFQASSLSWGRGLSVPINLGAKLSGRQEVSS